LEFFETAGPDPVKLSLALVRNEPRAQLDVRKRWRWQSPRRRSEVAAAIRADLAERYDSGPLIVPE